MTDFLLSSRNNYLLRPATVLNSPGWASVTTDKLSLDDGPNMFYVLIDEVRVCVCARARDADG